MPRFLIVDDDEVIHAYFRHMLLSLGEVSHAFSGQEALNLARQALELGTPFDCVLMDVRMPGMNGPQTVDGLKDIYRLKDLTPPKVAMISCLNQEQCLLETKQPCEADCYLTKPVERRTFLNTMSDMGFSLEQLEGEAGW
jgi:two-component system chemotaxis response regulator CheY